MKNETDIISDILECENAAKPLHSYEQVLFQQLATKLYTKYKRHFFFYIKAHVSEFNSWQLTFLQELYQDVLAWRHESWLAED